MEQLITDEHIWCVSLDFAVFFKAGEFPDIMHPYHWPTVKYTLIYMLHKLHFISLGTGLEALHVILTWIHS